MDRALWKEVCDSAVFDLTTPGITGNEENTLYNSYICIACWTMFIASNELKQRLATTADADRLEGQGRIGGLRVRWEDCVRRYFERLIEEWERKHKTDRGDWWRLVEKQARKAMKTTRNRRP